MAEEEMLFALITLTPPAQGDGRQALSRLQAMPSSFWPLGWGGD
ncbi:MAG TPA: hypothetical protein VFR79_02100 [Nitrospira sp.]|nr:hypothetical protein [Nitrospira sp.]